MIDFLKESQDLFEFTRFLRRDFHRHPELGFQEVRTAGIVARELSSLGLEVAAGIAETGVVALLECARPGPVVLLRFDMDALPIQEQSGADYASQLPGLMHACGHDAHVATGLTVARLLASHKHELAGTVKFVFQPAEEGLGGAEKMVAEGILRNPCPDIVLAQHVWNEKPLGWFGIPDGPAMAAAEIFRVILQGKGGHGAAPHLSVDPLVAAAQVVTALQSIVARNVSPLKTAVVSTTMIKAGDAFNVIPHQVEMQGTIRTFEPEVRETVMKRFLEVAEGVGSAMGCQVEVHFQSITPALVNRPEVAERVRRVAKTLFPEAEISANYATMGSEDMAFLMQQTPGCFVFVGSANSAQGFDAPHHHPKFDIDEQALPRAAALMAASAVEFLLS